MLWGVAYGQSKVYIRGDSIVIQKINGNGELILENGTRNVTGGVLTNIGNGRTQFVTPSGGGAASLVKEGLKKRGDTIVIDNNRNIYYINQPTSGSSLATGWSAVGTPGYTVSNGQWIFGGNANNNTQYIRSNSGVLSEKSTIEAYVVIDSVRTSSIGPGVAYFSYNPFSGGAYTHNVEFRFVTGSSATNYGKITIYGKTGNSTNSSDSARQVNLGDTLFFRADRDGLAYTLRVENITQDWKLYKSVQCTPGGSPFVPHNSSYVAFTPGGGGYKVYGFRYYDRAPIQTDLAINGNSITQRQGAVTEGGGYSSLVGDPSNNIVQGGGADGVSEVYARVGEIIAIHPRAVLMMIGGNDILFDGSLTTTTKNEYIALRDSLVNNGIAVLHCFPTPRTATDVSALKIWLDTLTTFRSDIKIDTYTPLLGSGTSLAAKYDLDGTHPNDAGHAMIASIINTALHYSNGDALYVTKNLMARNGYVLGTDAGTGPDQNRAGGWITTLQGSLTQYMHGGFYSDYGWINAISEGSAYRDIGISTAGTAKLFIGSSANRLAKLTVTESAAGDVEILALRHGGAFSAVGQSSRMYWYNGTSAKTGMFANVVGTGSMFDLSFTTYNGGMNTIPALYLMGDNKVKLSNIPFVASKDTVMYWDPSDSVLKRTLITGGGGGGVTNVATGYGVSGGPITTTGTITADTTVGTGLISWYRWAKLRDSLGSVFGGGGGGSYINNQWGGQQNARFWINGAGETDSSFRGRTTGASSGFKTGGLIAYGASGRSSYLQLGYDATLAAGWFQAVTEGSAYRDVIFNAAGGNVGIGALTTLPSTLLHLKKTNYPAIRLEKTGTGSWYLGNRTESTGTDYNISYNTTDWIQVKITGETGIGNISPREILDVNGQVSIRTVNAATSTSIDSVAVMEDGRLKTVVGYFASGTYTPTATNVSNLDASTPSVWQYMRVGNTVTVSGEVFLNPTTISTLTEIRFTLPIASSLTAATQCAGTASSPAASFGTIAGDATNDQAFLTLNSVTWTDNQPIYIHFTYSVL